MTSVYRFMVFSPPDALEAIKRAVVAAGGAEFGEYSEVFWSSVPGVEQFRPGMGAQPTFGEPGNLSCTESTQLVFAVPKDDALLARVAEAVRAAHPWEEPVIFIEETWVC